MSPLHPNFEVAPWYPKTPIAPIVPGRVVGGHDEPMTLPTRRGLTLPTILLAILALFLTLLAAAANRFQSPAGVSSIEDSRRDSVESPGSDSGKNFDRNLAKTSEMDVIRQEKVAISLDRGGEMKTIAEFKEMASANLGCSPEDGPRDGYPFNTIGLKEFVEFRKQVHVARPDWFDPALQGTQFAYGAGTARDPDFVETIFGAELEGGRPINRVNDDNAIQINKHHAVLSDCFSEDSGIPIARQRASYSSSSSFRRASSALISSIERP